MTLRWLDIHIGVGGLQPNVVRQNPCLSLARVYRAGELGFLHIQHAPPMSPASYVHVNQPRYWLYHYHAHFPTIFMKFQL